jgi:hypothetical protein
MENHQGPDPVFLSEERPGSIAPPPKLSQSQTVKKTTASKPMRLNFTLHQ